MRRDDEASVQNPPENASTAQSRDGRFYLSFMFLLIAAYAVIGYGVYKVIDSLV